MGKFPFSWHMNQDINVSSEHVGLLHFTFTFLCMRGVHLLLNLHFYNQLLSKNNNLEESDIHLLAHNLLTLLNSWQGVSTCSLTNMCYS